MPSNDLIILDKILEQRQQEIAPDLAAPDFFELFAIEQIVKDHDLSYDELVAGQVGGGGDGGIDGMYLFVNGELVQEDSDLSGLKRDVTIDLIIIQCSSGGSFAEASLDRLVAVSGDLLSLDSDPSKLATVYNAELLNSMLLFKQTYNALAARFPRLGITYHYATKGEQPHPNVTRKVESLRSLVRQKFSNVEFSFTFHGAAELLALARRSPRVTHSLQLAENPISSSGAFVCVVRLGDFFTFITDDERRLLRGLFEANVRDYQGLNEVNEDIQQSLQEAGPEEFWWLNNGITVLASKATLSGKILTIEDPQIVNGLQTSTQLYNHFTTRNTERETRNLLVRVIVPAAAESRDRIIKATNNQTRIPTASLRATEKIQRDIEEYLRTYGLFYDRRKNFYKNEGKPVEKIVSIPQLAQAVMALALRRPNTARARPSSLLKNDEDYATIFNGQYPIALYLLCARVMKAVDKMLRTDRSLAPEDRNNLHFHVGMVAVGLAADKPEPRPDEVAHLNPDLFTDDLLGRALRMARERYKSLGATDQVAKGPLFVDELMGDLRRLLSPGGTAGIDVSTPTS